MDSRKENEVRDGLTLGALNDPVFTCSCLSYYEHKHKHGSRYQGVKALLRGEGGPFSGWLVSGQKWELFDLNGDVVPE